MSLNAGAPQSLAKCTGGLLQLTRRGYASHILRAFRFMQCAARTNTACAPRATRACATSGKAESRQCWPSSPASVKPRIEVVGALASGARSRRAGHRQHEPQSVTAFQRSRPGRPAKLPRRTAPGRPAFRSDRLAHAPPALRPEDGARDGGLIRSNLHAGARGNTVCKTAVGYGRRRCF